MAARLPPTWATAIEGASRSVLVQISNFTHFQLKLKRAHLEAGEWALVAPKVIPPYGEGKLAVISTTPFTGAEVIADFTILGLPKAAAGIQFAAGNHLISGRFSSASVSEHEAKNFAIRKTENSDSRYSVSWSLKTLYPAPIPSQNQNASSTASTSTNPAKAPEPVMQRGLPPVQASIDPTNINTTENNASQSLNQSSSALANASQWQVQYNVLNDTNTTWILDEKGLDAGDWSREPQMTIKPFSRITWYSLPSFAGVLGYAKYHADKAPEIIFFTKWSAKVLAKPQIEAIMGGPKSRTLDLEHRVSHTSDCIVVDVTIFSEGSHGKGDQNLTFKKSQSSSVSRDSSERNNAKPTGPLRKTQSGSDGMVKDLSSPTISLSRVAPLAGGVSSISLKVFRLPIEVLVEREGRGHVPWLVESLCQWLISEHVATRGLFAQGGRYNEIKLLKSMIESGEAMERVNDEGNSFWNSYAPTSVLSIFKLFLRELPVPLIPTLLIPHFISIESSDSASSYVRLDKVIPILTDSKASAQSTETAWSDAAAASNDDSTENQAQNQGPNLIVQAIAHFLKELAPVSRSTLVYIAKSLKTLWKSPGSVHTLDSIAITFAPLIAPDTPDGALKCALPVISSFSALLENIDAGQLQT